MSRHDPRSFGRKAEPEPITQRQAVARIIACACLTWFAIFLGIGLAVERHAAVFVGLAFSALIAAVVAGEGV